MIFSLAGTYVIEGNYEDMMQAVEYSDYVFCNGDESLMMAKKNATNPEEAMDRKFAAKYLANYKKVNTNRPRIVIVTQGSG